MKNKYSGVDGGGDEVTMNDLVNLVSEDIFNGL
jgi:hypothetical protein